jgi:lysophospholipase L1-like esterase
MRIFTSLLCLALVVLLAARLTMAKVSASGPTKVERAQKIDIKRFEDSISRFEADDRRNPPRAGSTLFVGSSTIANWHSLADDFGNMRTLNRGFGGSTINEVTHYADRVVVKYRPARIVFYAGTNDIGELGHSGAQVHQDFVNFVETVRRDLPHTPIYFISLSVAPVRLVNASDYRAGNVLVANYCRETPNLHFIDVTKAMRESDGRLNEKLFGPDRLHMNEKGYAVWTPIIRKALKS